MSDIAAQIRNLIDDELHGVYTVLMCVVEKVDEQNRRLEVSLKADKEVIIDDIPIASNYTGDGYGELYPVHPNDEGLLLVSKDPIDEMIQEKGHLDLEPHRKHSFQDSIFLPRVFFDEDEVPEHEVGEYLLAHESGTWVHIFEDGRYLVDHPDGLQFELDEEHVFIDDGKDSTIRVDTNPEPHQGLLDEYNEEWPDSHLQIAHSSGIGLEVTDDGISISTVEDETENKERPEDTAMTHGHITDPHRIQFQEHRHLIPDESGSGYLLSGPPLSQRMMFDALLGTEITPNINNLTIPQYEPLITYYEDYLAWLESEAGQTLDPTMPRDAQDLPDYDADLNWLDVEPIPDTEEEETWGPQ